MAYTIEYTADANRQLRGLKRRDQTAVEIEIERQLTGQPDVESQKRKMRRNDATYPYQLRVGDCRVLYSVEGNIVEHSRHRNQTEQPAFHRWEGVECQ